jgi:very-short-patch-repair endonuclease
MEILEFLKKNLLNNRFKESYVDELLKPGSLLTEEDFKFYETNKSNNIWKIRIFKKLNFKSFTPQALNFWIYRGYSELEARDLVNSNKVTRKEPTPMQKEFWISKGLSESEATYKIKTFRKTNPEYWESRGYTLEEAKAQISEYQKENSEKFKSKKILKPELFEDISQSQKKYWIRKGMTEDEAIKKVSEVQTTFSLEKCIEKYGEEAGRKRWSERQEKWAKNYKKSNYSKISQDLFWELIDSGKINLSKKIHFATYHNGKFSDDINREHVINTENSVIKPDFVILEDKKIIEFDGIYWHNHNRRNKPENYKRERIRDENLIKAGYQILRINEAELKENSEKTIEKCLNFLIN